MFSCRSNGNIGSAPAWARCHKSPLSTMLWAGSLMGRMRRTPCWGPRAQPATVQGLLNPDTCSWAGILTPGPHLSLLLAWFSARTATTMSSGRNMKGEASGCRDLDLRPCTL